jgi:hypothetical protein
MVGYSKSAQIGKTVNPKKKKKDGSTLSRNEEWERARAKLKLIYLSHKITHCEYVDNNGDKCKSGNGLGFAHKNKRGNLEPGDLGSINETLLLCANHHAMIEYDREETLRLFSQLRPI